MTVLAVPSSSTLSGLNIPNVAEPRVGVGCRPYPGIAGGSMRSTVLILSIDLS